jgi:predicted aspartyl protease
MRVDGRAPAPAVFDTGTTGNAVDDDFAREAGLTPFRTETVIDGSTGTRFQAPQVRLSALSFSGVMVCGQEATVYAYDRDDEVAIVGPNMFSGRLVYLELDRQRVRVIERAAASPPPEPGRSYLNPEDEGSALPAIGVTLPGGVEISAMLDSGHNSELSLPMELMDRVPLEAPAIQIGVARSVSGERPVFQGRIMGPVRVGPLELDSPVVHFGGRDANVGYGLMRRMTIVMDPENNLAWAVAPRALSPEAQADFVGRYGVRSVRQEGDALIYQRDDRPAYVMRPVGGDMFDLEEGSRVQFRRVDGRVTGFLLIAPDGRSLDAPRTDQGAAKSGDG